MSDGLRRFARDVGYSLSGLVVSGAAHFVLRIFLARYLGAGDLGLYTLSFTAYSFGQLLSAFGIGAALTKYVAEFKDDVPRINLLVSSGSLASFIIGIVMGLMLFIAAAPAATRFFDMPELDPLLRIIAISLPFIALEKAIMGFLRGLRRMRIYATLEIFQNVLTVILTAALVLMGYGLDGAVLSLVLAIILTSLFSLFIIRRSLTIPTVSQLSQTAKMLTVFGLYVVLANGVGLINSNTDQIMLGRFMTEVDVGIYNAAVVLTTVIRQPSAAIQAITSPMIATYWGKREIRSIETLINKTMKYVAAVMIPAGFLAGFLGKEVILLIFGAEFTAAVIPFQILLLGGVISAIQASVGTALASTAYVNMIFKLSGIAVVANIILNWLLIPLLGIAGAAISTTLSVIISAALDLYFTQQLIRIKIEWGWFGRLLVFTMLLSGVTYGLGLVFNKYILVSLALVILLVVLINYFVDKDDLRLVTRLFSKIKDS